MALELLSSTHVETRVSAIKLLSLMLVSLSFCRALYNVAAVLLWWPSVR